MCSFLFILELRVFLYFAGRGISCKHFFHFRICSTTILFPHSGCVPNTVSANVPKTLLFLHNRTTVKAYDAVMKTLAMRIVKLLVSGVGIKAWRFDEFLAGVEATLRWNYQPRCPRPENAMALCPHKDPYLVTLQHDSGGIGGLQIWRKERWLGVPPRADALIVNVGDVFEVRARNDLWQSVFWFDFRKVTKPLNNVWYC